MIPNPDGSIKGLAQSTHHVKIAVQSVSIREIPPKQAQFSDVRILLVISKWLNQMRLITVTTCSTAKRVPLGSSW